MLTLLEPAQGVTARREAVTPFGRIPVTAGAIMFAAAAFPFLIPVIPSTDTQPTFAFLVIIFSFLAAVLGYGRAFPLARDRVVACTAISLAAGFLLCASLVSNDFAAGEMSRIGSFILFLISLAAGIIYPDIFTKRRIIVSLWVYFVFTFLFFVTGGAIESVIIQSRGSDAFAQMALSGRGSSTLSPEPSFFAFQIFTLYLAYDIIAGESVDPDFPIARLLSLLLLSSTLGGYGVIYCGVIIFVSGWRFIVKSIFIGTGFITFVVIQLGAESLRFIGLFIALFTSLLSDNAVTISDVSTLGRVNSFFEYIRTMSDHPFLGDAFATYSGGGLVSLLASIGLAPLILFILFLAAVVSLPVRISLKLGIVIWFVVQFISGPIGLPFVGLFMGAVIAIAWRRTTRWHGTAAPYSHGQRRN